MRKETLKQLCANCEYCKRIKENSYDSDWDWDLLRNHGKSYGFICTINKSCRKLSYMTERYCPKIKDYTKNSIEAAIERSKHALNKCNDKIENLQVRRIMLEERILKLEEQLKDC